MNRLAQNILAAGSLALLSSCAGFQLDRVDFAWPVESAVTVSALNTIEDVRYGVAAGVANLAMEEFQDSSALRGTELRLLRSSEGYYFVTGPRFKHVYVFTPGAYSLSLSSAIMVSESGLKSPALNQRPPHIELVDGDGFRRLLTNDDIVEAKK